MTQATLVCQKARLTIGPCVALDDVTLTLPLSGITILRGRNGAGKTSFLRALLGLEQPQSGHIHILGLSPQQARQKIGYMPQKAGEAAPMLPVISHVMANIAGPRWGFPLTRGHRQKAMEKLALTGAGSLASRPIGVLSGGERQRVALAQALAGDPELLILDEPLAALDATARQESLALFDHLHRTLGIHLLMTAHETLSLDGLSDPVREIRLEGGQLHV